MPNIIKLINNYHIIIILFIGLLIRLVSIDQSLWLDEAISVFAATNYNIKNLLGTYMIGDFNPPLYNLVLFFWLKIFPTTELFIRLPSVIFGLLTVVYVYKIGRFVSGGNSGPVSGHLQSKLAVLASLFLATSPLHLYYSQEARMYSLAAFTASASMYYFIRLIKEENILNSIFYILYSILMLYSHYLCWLIVPVQFVYFSFIHKKKIRKLTWAYLLSCLTSFLFVLPWLPILLKQLNIGRSAAINNPVWHKTVGGPSLKSILLLPVKFIIGRTSFENKNLYLLISLLLLSFFFYLLILALKNRRSKLICLCWLWLIMPLVLGLVISFWTPVFSYFRFLFCLPAFYLLISFAVLKSKHSKTILILVLLINVFFSLRYLLNSKFHRENWKEAVNTLHQKNTSKAKVLILQNVTAPFNFYDQNKSKKVYFSQKEKISQSLEVWLIPYAQPIFDSNDNTRKFLEAKGFIRVFEKHFRGVTLEKWQKLFVQKIPNPVWITQN